MPRRFFRKFAIKRHQLADSRLLAPFRHMLHEPRYWGIARRTCVPAFSLGLFIGWLPFPGHPFTAALAALALKVNVPVSMLSTFISNPITMYPMYYSAYRLGRKLLGSPPVAFDFELSFAWLGDKFLTIWQPLTLGCLLLGAVSSLLGYIILDIFWRLSLRDYKLEKRRRRSASDSGTRK